MPGRRGDRTMETGAGRGSGSGRQGPLHPCTSFCPHGVYCEKWAMQTSPAVAGGDASRGGIWVGGRCMGVNLAVLTQPNFGSRHSSLFLEQIGLDRETYKVMGQVNGF